MDNLFQLLIFLFVIYTIINSIFGKKKPQSPDKNIPRKSDDTEPDSPPQPRYSSSGDILQDLFGFKIPKTGDEYESYPPKRYPTNLEQDLPEIESQSEIDVKYVSDNESRNLPDIDYDKLPSLEVAQESSLLQDYHTAYEMSSSLNQRTIELIQKIKNPNSLRELYLISEILNKPKAFRR